MFRLEGVCDSKKSPLAPLFEKGGNAYRPASLLDARAGLEPPQALTSPSFDKGGQEDFKKEPRSLLSKAGGGIDDY